MKIFHGISIFLIIIGLGAAAESRSLYIPRADKPLVSSADSLPYVTYAVHNVGRIALGISNFGIIGRGSSDQIADPLTGDDMPSLSYPQGYPNTYLYEGQLWVGAIVGRDTLVSTGGGPEDEVREFWPDAYPDGDIQYRSIKDPDAPEYTDAVSQQDFVATYYDTLRNTALSGYDYYSKRYHVPMGLKVTQESYAWGYDYAEDFVLFDYKVANIGINTMKNVYIGLYFDNDIGRDYQYIGSDDICGFSRAARSQYIAGLMDTINIAWAADNDGDPNAAGALTHYSPTAVVATRILRTPSDSLHFSYNWWVSSYRSDEDWGPRKAETPDDPFRLFSGFLGTPASDADKYYMMSHDEFDYNQSEISINHSASGWLPPPSNAARIAAGADIRYLLSIGPFNMEPGDILPFTFTIAAGDSFHSGYSLTDLNLNALWAGWIYDNPGVDTDGDGYMGKYHIYCIDSIFVGVDTTYIGSIIQYDTIWGCQRGDTMFYAGDGIPDFKGASPPPSPKMRLYPRIGEYNQGEIEILWNGRLCETSLDQFSQKIDFEGYRVYISISGRVDDFTLVTSYDIENYDRWEYDNLDKIWEINNQPYTLKTLKKYYGDSFDPDKYYNTDNLFVFYNSITRLTESYYFSKHDWNQSDYRDTLRIHKIYPDQPYPSTLNMDSAAMFYPDELTSDGYLKYFEYRYVLRNLLPSQPYYVSVSTFDQGVPGKNLPPLETTPTENAQREFAQNSSSLVEQKDLKVIVYPNPYRIDGGYRERFEGWEDPDLPAERTRAIHFTNLPHKCTIRIFTLDGDLVRQIEHNYAKGSAGSMHEQWDMISRNTMTITSGIYYFSVDSELGNQLGKLVIIK